MKRPLYIGRGFTCDRQDAVQQSTERNDVIPDLDLPTNGEPL